MLLFLLQRFAKGKWELRALVEDLSLSLQNNFRGLDSREALGARWHYLEMVNTAKQVRTWTPLSVAFTD